MAYSASIFLPEERTGVLLQGETLAACAAVEGITPDFGHLRRALARQTKLVSLTYYPAPPDPDRTLPGTARDLPTDARSAGFHVVRPPPAPPDLRIRPGEWIKRQLTEAAVQMFMLSRHADHILLCAGDAAAVPLVRMVQREGVRVSVISSAANRPRLIADDLRRQADHFLEFRDWRGIFARTAD